MKEKTYTEIGLWGDLERRKADYFRSLAAICKFAAKCPDDDQFAALLGEAQLRGVITKSELCGMDRLADLSTIEKWANGAAAPTAHKQAQVLVSIAARCTSQADEIDKPIREKIYKTVGGVQ